MANINLLPWRLERRERRKREFFSRLGLAAIVAILLVLLWWLWMNARIAQQESNNNYLRDQIKQQQAKIVEIDNLQKVKDRLLARKKIIEKLQSSRSQMVHLFDEIVKSIPAGARLTGLKQQGDQLTLDGVAQSNSTVAQYMKNIQASPWMGPAKLVQTQNTHGDANTPYTFELVVTLGVPKSSADANGAQPASAASTATPAVAASTAAPAVALPTSSAPAMLPSVGAPAAATPSAAATPAASGAATEPAPLPSAPKPSTPTRAAASAAPPAAASSHKGGAKS